MPIVIGEILRRCLIQLEVGLRDYTMQHYQQIMECLYHADRINRKFPGNIDCVVDEKFLFLRKSPGSGKPIPDVPVQLEIGAAVRYGPFQITSIRIEPQPDLSFPIQKEETNWVECLDADQIRGPVWIRPRRPGDRFRPLGMSAEKKVGKFLTAARVSPEIREKVFIVEDSEKILWVAPIRICEQAKVIKKTRQILQISIK